MQIVGRKKFGMRELFSQENNRKLGNLVFKWVKLNKNKSDQIYIRMEKMF